MASTGWYKCPNFKFELDTSLEKSKKIEEIVRSLGDTVSVDSIIEKMNKAGIGGGKLRKEGNVIVGIYDQCYCPSRKHIKSNIYCRCTRG